jgi:hypothetical protein
MNMRSKAVVLCAALTICLWNLPAAAAGEPKPVATAPIPTQIMAAKKVFIANGGGDQLTEDDPIFSGGPDRAYNQFYAAIKTWGRFDIVASPADADLLLEIRQEVQIGSLGGKAGGFATPLFHLEIRDPKTNALLWAFHIHAKFGVGQTNSDRNFDQGVNRLVMEMRALVTPADQS